MSCHATIRLGTRQKTSWSGPGLLCPGDDAKGRAALLDGIWRQISDILAECVANQGLLKRQTSLGRVFVSLAQAALMVNILNTMSLGLQVRPDSGSFLLKRLPDTRLRPCATANLCVDTVYNLSKFVFVRCSNVMVLPTKTVTSHWGSARLESIPEVEELGPAARRALTLVEVAAQRHPEIVVSGHDHHVTVHQLAHDQWLHIRSPACLCHRVLPAFPGTSAWLAT